MEIKTIERVGALRIVDVEYNKKPSDVLLDVKIIAEDEAGQRYAYKAGAFVSDIRMLDNHCRVSDCYSEAHFKVDCTPMCSHHKQRFETAFEPELETFLSRGY